MGNRTHYSPDGRAWWDGTQWVPGRPPQRSRTPWIIAGAVGAVVVVATTVIVIVANTSGPAEIASPVSSTTETTTTTTTRREQLTYQPIPRTTIPRIVPTGPHAPVACGPDDRRACMPGLTIKSVQASLTSAGLTCVESTQSCTKGSRDDGVTVVPSGPASGDGPVTTVRVNANVVARGQGAPDRREDTLARATEGAEAAVRVLFANDSDLQQQLLSVVRADIRQCGSSKELHGRDFNGYTVTCSGYTAIGVGSGPSAITSHSAGVTIATSLFLGR